MRVGDLFATRRELLRYGGMGLLGACAQGVWPLDVRASETRARPRGCARNVLFYEVSGAISHVESFDFKENAGSPNDLDFRKVRDGLWMSELLFPRLTKHMDKFAIVRSMHSHEEVHFRGQYYVQTGRQLNVAFAREIPAIGSVIALELEPRRRANDTFPTYMSFYLEKGAAGALSTGFLPPRFSVLDINPEAAVRSDALDRKAVELAEQRWQLLSKLRVASGQVPRNRLPKEMSGYQDFYEAAHQLLSDERWPRAFRITEEDRKRYGANPVGVAAAMARNVLAEDAGTHYIHLCHPEWDHHTHIWDRSVKSNHYVLCAEMDAALSSLMEDLATTRSKTDPQKTLLDETLVVVMGEFGRTPGALNNMAGRDHHNPCYPALFAGAGVRANRILGQSDTDGAKCIETGWEHKEQPRPENITSTIYSALGIDWSKEIRNTPSGRTYPYVDPLGPHGYIPIDEIATIFA